MDGYLVQNMINTFSEAGYYLNLDIMVIFDNQSKSYLAYSLLTEN